ncbi:hypothetical protein Shyhy02_63730 [Streptomyces hygroscopicus subsp. hygroscopicus]|nr:hypothetical protein Shyhy02_63730 [Streptomyces hygroscopicus subsp. hygroscopicus]
MRAVGFVMQPEHHVDLRPAAERYLSRHLNGHTWRYFERRRLTGLGLPGAAPARRVLVPRTATVRRTGLRRGGRGPLPHAARRTRQGPPAVWTATTRPTSGRGTTRPER